MQPSVFGEVDGPSLKLQNLSLSSAFAALQRVQRPYLRSSGGGSGRTVGQHPIESLELNRKIDEKGEN